jgi:DNA repair exonuclease SbcCD ATPase subunit
MPSRRASSGDARERLASLETEFKHLAEKLTGLTSQTEEQESQLSALRTDVAQIRSYARAFMKISAGLVLLYLSGGKDSDLISAILKQLFPALFAGQ